MKITVVGSGAWGTALALLLLENGNDVTLWSYHQEESNRMRDTHENPMQMCIRDRPKAISPMTPVEPMITTKIR